MLPAGPGVGGRGQRFVSRGGPPSLAAAGRSMARENPGGSAPTLTSPLLRGAVTQACAARVRRCHRARTGRRDAECTTIHELCRGGSVVVEDVRWCLGGHGAAIGSVHHGISDNVTFRRLLLTAGITQAIDCGGGCRIKS